MVLVVEIEGGMIRDTSGPYVELNRDFEGMDCDDLYSTHHRLTTYLENEGKVDLTDVGREMVTKYLDDLSHLLDEIKLDKQKSS